MDGWVGWHCTEALHAFRREPGRGPHICIARLLQSTDLAGKDDNVCVITEYDGGSLLDDDLCGSWLTPSNQGQQPLTATVNGAAVTIGALIAVMKTDGT